MKNTIKILVLFITFQSFSQVKNIIPNWFQKNMESSIGTWIASNSKYQNNNEPITSYVMEWEWAIDKKSINGKLYGYINQQKTGLFWEFKQYWDFKNRKGVIIQYGANGTIGKGFVKNTGTATTESEQTFTSIDGKSHLEKHKNSFSKNSFTSISFNKKGNKWSKQRSYTWIKQKTNLSADFGNLSISLAVKDIKKSKAFYESLGYRIVDGNITQKWLVLKNKNSKIGLFQGFFPKNTITFNPKDARTIYKKLIDKKTSIIMKTGMDKKSGKASFMISDPDGNPILFDQHQ